MARVENPVNGTVTPFINYSDVGGHDAAAQNYAVVDPYTLFRLAGQR